MKLKFKFKIQCTGCNREFKSWGWFYRHMTVISKNNDDCLNPSTYNSVAIVYLDDDSI